jgi:hypothetical protein
MRLEKQLIGTATLLAVLGCGGSNEKPDNTAWETRQGFRMPGVNEEGEVDFAAKSTRFSGFDWVGVRHDLAINPNLEQKTPECSCLAVEMGDPNDPRFVWRGPKPDLNPVNVAIAVSAFNVDCPGGSANKADLRSARSTALGKTSSSKLRSFLPTARSQRARSCVRSSQAGTCTSDRAKRISLTRRFRVSSSAA